MDIGGLELEDEDGWEVAREGGEEGVEEFGGSKVKR